MSVVQYVDVASEHPELTLLCDGCDDFFHVGCVGLQSVPHGNWYCETCAHIVSAAASEQVNNSIVNINNNNADNAVSHEVNNRNAARAELNINNDDAVSLADEANNNDNTESEEILRGFSEELSGTCSISDYCFTQIVNNANNAIELAGFINNDDEHNDVWLTGQDDNWTPPAHNNVNAVANVVIESANEIHFADDDKNQFSIDNNGYCVAAGSNNNNTNNSINNNTSILEILEDEEKKQCIELRNIAGVDNGRSQISHMTIPTPPCHGAAISTTSVYFKLRDHGINDDADLSQLSQALSQIETVFDCDNDNVVPQDAAELKPNNKRKFSEANLQNCADEQPRKRKKLMK